jgi:hypothetical protein
MSNMKNFPGYLRIFVPVISLLIILGCSVDRYPLPNYEQSRHLISDTMFIQHTKWIDLDPGAAPEDIFIDDDGHIYVAETGLGKVSVWDQALNRLPLDYAVEGVKGVCVSREEILFTVSGDSAVYAHHLQLERENVQVVVNELYLQNTISGDTVLFTPQDYLDTFSSMQMVTIYNGGDVNNYRLALMDTLDRNSEEYQRISQPHRFYTKTTAGLINNYQIDAIAPGRPGAREIIIGINEPDASFGTSSAIHRLRYSVSSIAFTDNPEEPIVYLYEFKGTTNVVLNGSGSANVLGVLGMDADAEGSIYWTQTTNGSGNFQVRRFLFALDNDSTAEWTNDASILTSEMLFRDRFNQPLDITYSSSNIYIVDNQPDGSGHRVQVFERSGNFISYCGATRVYTDTSYVVDDVEVEEVLKSWNFDQLSNPRSVAAFGNRSRDVGTGEEVVFVADEDRILMFSLSVSDADNPIE